MKRPTLALSDNFFKENSKKTKDYPYVSTDRSQCSISPSKSKFIFWRCCPRNFITIDIYSSYFVLNSITSFNSERNREWSTYSKRISTGIEMDFEKQKLVKCWTVLTPSTNQFICEVCYMYENQILTRHHNNRIRVRLYA